MQTKYFLIPLVGISLFLTAATTTPKAETKVAKDTTAKVNIPFEPSAQMKVKKMGFFQKLAFKIMTRKLKKHHYKIPYDTAKADKMANASLGLGIAALVFVLIPFYTIFLAIPLGIMAMVFGSNAKKSGTQKTTNASLGKAFGLAALIVFVLYIILAAIFIASWASW